MAEKGKSFSQKHPVAYEVIVLSFGVFVGVFLGLMTYNVVQTKVMPAIMGGEKSA